MNTPQRLHILQRAQRAALKLRDEAMIAFIDQAIAHDRRTLDLDEQWRVQQLTAAPAPLTRATVIAAHERGAGHLLELVELALAAARRDGDRSAQASLLAVLAETRPALDISWRSAPPLAPSALSDAPVARRRTPRSALIRAA